MRIEGHTFLVAGGGSGLGETTTRMLAELGANVVVADLKGEGLPENVRFVATDVTDERAVQSAVDAALESRGCTAPSTAPGSPSRKRSSDGKGRTR